MSRNYALRFDVFEETKSKLSNWLSKNCDGWIVAYEEAGDNKHCHAILSSTRNLKQLRNAFVYTFSENAGNKGYSLKVCDDDHAAYIRYICKGGAADEPPVIWSHQGLLYTEETIKEAWQKYWVNNEAMKENSAKRAKVEKLNIVEQVEKAAKAKGLKGYERVEVAKIYIRLFRDARKGINVFAARAVVNTVCCLLEGSDEDHLATKIADL